MDHILHRHLNCRRRGIVRNDFGSRQNNGEKRKKEKKTFGNKLTSMWLTLSTL